MNILITGAGSGIGKAVKDEFLKNGHRVYAIDLLNMEEESNLETYRADITKEEELIAIKKEIENIELDVIVNIAGIHMMSSLIESNYEKMKKVIEVNLCGAILVNKTFHSLLSKKGRVVIVTSEVATYDSMPFNSIYNISKTALDSYSQALRQELNLLGQKVITIRPGSVETPLSKGSLVGTNALANETALYKKSAHKFLYLFEKFMGKPMKAEKLAKIIYKASIKKHPKLIYKKHRTIGLILLNILPKRLQCWIIKMLLK